MNTKRLIHVSGKDANTFLQGQLTNDISLLNQNWQHSAYCNPKGQVIDLFMVWKASDTSFFIILSDDTANQTLARLKMYILRSDVTIKEMNCAFYFLHTLDNRIHHCFEEETVHHKDGQHACTVNHKTQSSLLTLQRGYLLITPQESTKNELSNDLQQWEQHDIECAIPHIGSALTEKFIPQIINLDLLNAISFKKGCYTGQEVIARTRYLGKLKQRLFLLSPTQKDSKSKNSINTSLQVGQAVYKDKNLQTKVGTLINGSPTQAKLLATIRLEYVDSELFIQNNDDIMGYKIEATQPYEIPAKQ